VPRLAWKAACPAQGYGVIGSKSREVIYGGRIIGARIRAEGAQEGYFWRVMYNDGDDEYLVGFVDQEDLILADAPVA